MSKIRNAAMLFGDKGHKSQIVAGKKKTFSDAINKNKYVSHSQPKLWYTPVRFDLPFGHPEIAWCSAIPRSKALVLEK